MTLDYFRRLRRLPLTASLIAFAAAGQLAAAQTVPAADAGTTAAATAPAQDANAANPGPAIAGFRSAAFGMTEAEVRAVISKDFDLPASAIQSGENPIEHTAVLNVAVPNLMPGGGKANVAYVFGYTSHKLIAINILWSKATDPTITPQQLYQNGESLQQYFAGESFPPQRSTGNVQLPGGVLLFRASDTSDNVVLLVLSGTMVKDPKAPDRTALNPSTLSLAYAADPEHADVFHLNKGSF